MTPYTQPPDAWRDLEQAWERVATDVRAAFADLGRRVANCFRRKQIKVRRCTTISLGLQCTRPAGHETTGRNSTLVDPLARLREDFATFGHRYDVENVGYTDSRRFHAHVWTRRA